MYPSYHIGQWIDSYDVDGGGGGVGGRGDDDDDDDYDKFALGSDGRAKIRMLARLDMHKRSK